MTVEEIFALVESALGFGALSVTLDRFRSIGFDDLRLSLCWDAGRSFSAMHQLSWCACQRMSNPKVYFGDLAHEWREGFRVAGEAGAVKK